MTGQLYNRFSRGVLNLRPGGAVRMHGSSQGSPAPPSSSSELRRVSLGAAAAVNGSCVPAERVRYEFTAQRGGGVAVLANGACECAELVAS